MAAELRTRPGIDEPDDFYEALIDAHAGLSEDESGRLNARLILLLANHIGDRDVLDQALAAARAADSRDRRDPAQASPSPIRRSST